MENSSDTLAEQRLGELEEIWHTSDVGISLAEFLRLSGHEYTRFVEGDIDAEEVMRLYDSRA